MNAKNHLAQTQAALEALDHEAIDRAGTTLVEALVQGGVIYTCGIGGSAAEALHLVEEVIGCYGNRRVRPAAVCLNADPTTLTCIANEFGYEKRLFKATRGVLADQKMFDRVEHQRGKPKHHQRLASCS